MGRDSAHSPLPTDEIEKKLNIYHKGAKIWKMLIFCQVEAAFPFCPGRRGQCGGGRVPKILFNMGVSVCGTFVDWV